LLSDVLGGVGETIEESLESAVEAAVTEELERCVVVEGVFVLEREGSVGG
jgi:hypothetical protein